VWLISGLILHAFIGELLCHAHGLLSLLRRHLLKHALGLLTELVTLLGHALGILPGLGHATEFLRHALHG